MLFFPQNEIADRRLILLFPIWRASTPPPLPYCEEYLYTYTISSPETLWDVNAEGFAQGIKTFRLTKPNKKKFREPGNEGILPPLPF